MELFDLSIFSLSIIQGRGGGSGSGDLPVCTTDASAAAGRAEVAGTTGRHCDAMPVPPPPTAPHHPLSRDPLSHRSSVLLPPLFSPHCATGDKSDKRIYHDARECASLTETIMS